MIGTFKIGYNGEFYVCFTPKKQSERQKKFALPTSNDKILPNHKCYSQAT